MNSEYNPHLFVVSNSKHPTHIFESSERAFEVAEEYNYCNVHEIICDNDNHSICHYWNYYEGEWVLVW